ncbi:MAG: hypothetical protein UV36_C0042G0010, partial [Parcubacteria group bacterium GW2011_GWC2_42_6]
YCLEFNVALADLADEKKDKNDV